MKIMTVFGTRPEAIKMAPLVLKINEETGMDSVLCVTAQHREMLDQVLDLFGLKADYDLDIMKENQTISQITANVILGLEKVIQKENPDIVLVHGDTTTTFASALAAYYSQKKIGHVEAGLRTYDKYSPYPEEMNRAMTGRLTDLHFAPTEKNRTNLLLEGIPPESIFVTGNTVIDALRVILEKPYEFEEEPLKTIDFSKNRVITVTCHRRENLGENIMNIFGAVNDIASCFKDVEIVYPVHMNPKVREAADKAFKGAERIHLTEPLAYRPFAELMARSHLIITDSGGMQEEAPALGKPVLVVRKETERPEAVEAGTVKLAGVERDKIFEAAKTLLSDDSEYEKMARAVNPYGDGFAAERIVEILKSMLP